MTRKRDVHLLSCARMFYSEQEAIKLAKTFGIERAPVLTATSVIFIIAPRRQFKDTWMDRRNGFYFVRGERAKRSDVLHKSNGSVGFNKVERKEAEKEPA